MTPERTSAPGAAGRPTPPSARSSPSGTFRIAAPPPTGPKALLDKALGAFGAQDRYFRIQACLVAGWLAVSIATIATLALSGGGGNALGAEVRAEMAVGGPVLLVTNTSGTPWTDVTYTLNGLYVYRQAALDPGGHLTVPVGRFRKGGTGGRHAPRDLEPKLLAIGCEEGQAQVPLSAGTAR